MVFTPDNLVLTRSVYAGTAATVTIGEPLPPDCPATAACGTGKATDNGSYPAIGSANNVWNNDDAVDGSFGVTSHIFLDELTLPGVTIKTFSVPPTTLTTSFSSKSELAVNLSLDRQYLTLMGYVAAENTLDVSNSNTPGVYDPTNPVGGTYYRGILQIDADGNLQLTETNAYSGNNGRAAILGNNVIYMVGNSNNGSGTAANVVASAGVQITARAPGQVPGAPTELGIFSIAQASNPATGKPYKADKLGKDNNFRGLTVFDNTVYVSKGSSNGINTVYQVGNAGTLPQLADAPNAPITILPGFPVTLAKAAGAQNPFGLWFADADTLYVADEGDGTAAGAATSTVSGLEKWIHVSGTWKLAYVLQNGLNLGVSYAIANYPASLNPVTDGLRTITGHVNADGTVTVWGITSTVSANGDQGADPNKLVSINDVLANTDPTVAAGEQFVTLRTAVAGEVLRGISFTPNSLKPLPITVTSSGLLYNRRTQLFNGTLTVTNIRPSAISGPFTVVLTGLTAGVTVVGSSTVNGSPALAIPGTANLASGQSVSIAVQFQDPSFAVINFAPAVIN